MLPTATEVHPYEATGEGTRVSDSSTRNGWMLFLASFLALYFELVAFAIFRQKFAYSPT